jgi:HEAT repeat protein
MFLISFSVYAQQDVEAARRDTIRFGTETEIANLIQSLRTENADYLDDELIVLVENTRNARILTGIFGFFGEREKNGLESRAIRAINERDDENNETVLSAIEYLGRVNSADAVPAILAVLNTEERRFLSVAFRAVGRASSANSALADEVAEFLADFYNYREPGNENRSVVITAIGDTGSSVGVPLLTDIATNTDERIPLRIAAIGALSRIGDEDGLDAILSNVNTSDPNVRSAAIAALGPFSGEVVDNAILEGFRDSFWRTRVAASQASRDRRLASAVPYLRFRAERDDVPGVRDEAIRALGAIANAEAIEVLNSLFSGRNNSDRVRILAADMLMKSNEGRDFGKLVVELDDARTRNQTNLYNGLLRVAGETVVEGDTSEIESLTRRFMRDGGLIEKLYALDMAANNNLGGLGEEIITLSKDRNETIRRRAFRTAERLGIEIPEE